MTGVNLYFSLGIFIYHKFVGICKLENRRPRDKKVRQGTVLRLDSRDPLGRYCPGTLRTFGMDL